jgi:transposase
MDLLHRCCAGLDVHKDSVVACVRRLDDRDRLHREVRTFPTVTAGLLDLLAWLQGHGVTHAAMESTGVYWKPIWNILEGHLHLLVVNAEHIKQVPGRKTDVADSEWIAQLLQHGLLRASFVPPAPIRELRDLTRQRAQLVAEKAAAANRIQKVLEDANLKLGSVASDVLGVSGRAMLADLIAGVTDPERLAEHAKGRMRSKRDSLRRALNGRVTEHHRFLLRLHLDHVTQLEDLVARLEQRVGALIDRDRPPDPPPDPSSPTVAESPPSAVTGGAGVSPPSAPVAPRAPLGLWEAVLLVMTIPGISRRTAEVVVSEIGTDMSRFATSGHLASWAGLCPGNDESAGKRRRGRTRHGNRWLRGSLVQAAWAASRTTTYLAAQYRRLAKRRGKKKALVAVAHSQLGIIYQVLTQRQAYRDLGVGYFDQRMPERLTQQLVKRLESLGHKVTLNAQAA